MKQVTFTCRKCDLFAKIAPNFRIFHRIKKLMILNQMLLLVYRVSSECKTKNSFAWLGKKVEISSGICDLPE